VNHAVSSEGSYEGAGRGSVPVLSAGPAHGCCAVVLNHAITSSRGAGVNQEVSSLALTGRTNNPKRRRIPTINPIRALVLIFIVKPLVIQGKAGLLEFLTIISFLYTVLLKTS
jgi:hypothetical protein